MVENNSTPERDLLKLIEEEGAHSAPAVTHAVRKGASFLSLGGLKGRFAFFAAAIGQGFKKEEINIKVVNRFLMAGLCIIFILVVMDISTSSVSLKKQLDAAFSLKVTPVITDFKEKTFLKDSSYYLDKTKKRDIFYRVSKEVAQAKQVDEHSQIKEVVEKTANLRLVGISWSDNPDVMIEDIEVKKTFFLQTGDMIGDVLVDEIYSDRVVLNYQGQTTELK